MSDMRMIDANVLTRWLESVLSNANPLDRKARAAFSEVLSRVKTMPDIDAVQVVRCRECKHHRDQLDDRFVICRRWRKIMEVDGFCHKGAKMDGGAEG